MKKAFSSSDKTVKSSGDRSGASRPQHQPSTKRHGASRPPHRDKPDEPQRRRQSEPKPRRGDRGKAKAQTEQRSQKVSPLSPPPPLPEIVPAPEEPGKTRFTDIDLAVEILAGVQDLEFKYCTVIQGKCLPPSIAGQDVAGKAQTGTGKTAAFLASTMTRLLRNPKPSRKPGSCRALVLAPTRELAIQIHKDATALGKYAGLNNLVIFGGMDHKAQRNSLSNPVDILVGTPGRIIDYSGSRHLDLSETEVLIIDEADRMLDMGFIPDVRRIVSKLPAPGKRQTMLFSATLEPEILKLVEKWLVNPVALEAEPEKVVTDLIEQRFFAVAESQKLSLLLWLLKNDSVERMIVFGNWKEKNRRIVSRLGSHGIQCELLSGDIPQTKRLKILESFKKGECPVLVATDVAARGIHVDGITHVVNYDIPEQPDDYVHRIGRTGRAGMKGKSVSFVCEFGAYSLPGVEKYIGCPVKTEQPDDAMLKLPPRLHGESDPRGVDEMEHHSRRNSRNPSFRGGGRRPPYKRGGRR